MTRYSRRVPSFREILPSHWEQMQRCAGCETQPTHGFSSKQPNADGTTRWCMNSLQLASGQEIARFYAERELATKNNGGVQ